MNFQIRAPELRVIDSEGKQVGVMPTAEALKSAQELGLDLVEIAPDAKPPVAKIIDFKKFKYLEERKEREARKKTKQTELKEVRFSPFIGEHDLQTGLEKVKKFLKDGDMVKISVVFKGRQMRHTEFGPKLLERIMNDLEGIGQIEREARMEGRRFNATLRPAKGAVLKQEHKEQNNETEN